MRMRLAVRRFNLHPLHPCTTSVLTGNVSHWSHANVHLLCIFAAKQRNSPYSALKCTTSTNTDLLRRAQPSGVVLRLADIAATY